jgi:autotransporter-associated beta strand protein
MGTKTLEMMKTMKPKLTILIAAMCGMFATTSAFSQTTRVWTNQAGGDLAVAANWDPNGLPDAGVGDTMEWNGTTKGNLVVSITSGLNGSSGNTGYTYYMNSAQTANLSIVPGSASAGPARSNGILIDNGAGQFGLGDDTLNTLEMVWGSAFTHILQNDSSTPAIVYPNIKWRMGGGGTHFFNFTGTGDWIVNNYVRNDNSAGSGVIKEGTGTLYWYGTNVSNASYPGVTVNGGLAINGGTVILKSSDLLNGQVIQNDTSGMGGTLLKYDAPVGVATPGIISGVGPIQVNAGTLTLTAANTYTGSNYLTGGELIVSSAENLGTSGPLGVGGTITFSGGTLGFSANNTFDYSSRFDTAAGQAYSFDTGGQNVSFANGLSSSGGTLTKVGSGMLTLAGPSSYNGATMISGGKLVFQGVKSGRCRRRGSRDHSHGRANHAGHADFGNKRGSDVGIQQSQQHDDGAAGSRHDCLGRHGDHQRE